MMPTKKELYKQGLSRREAVLYHKARKEQGTVEDSSQEAHSEAVSAATAKRGAGVGSRYGKE